MRVNSSLLGERRTFSSTIGAAWVVTFGDNLHCVAADTLEHDLLIRRERHRVDALMIAAERFDVPGGLHPQLLLGNEREAPWQRHNLIPAFGGLPRVHVKDHDDSALAIRCR